MSDEETQILITGDYNNLNLILESDSSSIDNNTKKIDNIELEKIVEERLEEIENQIWGTKDENGVFSSMPDPYNNEEDYIKWLEQNTLNKILGPDGNNSINGKQLELFVKSGFAGPQTLIVPKLSDGVVPYDQNKLRNFYKPISIIYNNILDYGITGDNTGLEFFGVESFDSGIKRNSLGYFIDGVITEKKIFTYDNINIEYFVTRPSSGIQKKIIYKIHGGALMTGNDGFGTYQYNREKLAKDLNVVVIGINYRLLAEDGIIFPKPLNDCVALLKHIASGNEPNIPKDNIMIMGDSAGGYLCVATMLQLLEDGDNNIVKAIFLDSPLFVRTLTREPLLESYKKNDGIIIPLLSFDAIFTLYTDDKKENYNNIKCRPCIATPEDLKNFPPTFILSGEYDPLRDEGVEFLNNLTKAGVIAEGIILNNGIHVHSHLFSLFSDSFRTKIFYILVENFLNKHVN